MAINKSVNKSSKNVGGMRNCLEYVLREQKVKGGYITMTGPAPQDINWDSVYQAFMQEKQIWGKENGRLYAHNVISFHKDEEITPEQAFEISQEVVAKTFPNHQTLIAVHQDKDHIHAHLVTNSVSYVDGHKLHMTKYDLENMKQLTNQLCLNRGLTIAHKGKHFDGSDIEEDTIISWSKDKYQSLLKKLNTILIDCVTAVIAAKTFSTSKDDFIQRLSESGWKTVWEEHRKHLTFINDDNRKIRDSNISKNYSLDISKESLKKTFELNREQQLTLSEYNEIKMQLQSNKDLRSIIAIRIESFEQYIHDYQPGELERKKIFDKVEQLNTDLRQIDEVIEFLNAKINNPHIKRLDNEKVVEKIKVNDGPRMHF